MTITVYTFEDANGNEVGSYSTQSSADASDHARQHGYNVKANEYEFADSYLVDEWCFAESGPRPMHDPIPDDFPVRPLGAADEATSWATCGHCHLSWDDAIPTQYTPTPSARCPFEYFHITTIAVSSKETKSND